MTNSVNEKLNDFGQLYNRYKKQEPVSQQLLQGQNRYLINLTFDPLTGEALPMRMSHWANQNKHMLNAEVLHDRFIYLLTHCSDAINNILLMPRQTINRVHEMTPVYLAQRLDSRSVQWLSRKPGNNLREKLSANPHILASSRKMSFDTLENRLLKAFLIHIQRLLLDRQEADVELTDDHANLIDVIQKNLQREEFSEIKPWQHMPPNNVLLQDKQYRKVWRSWQLLNCLEEDCEYQQMSSIASSFGIFSELLKQLSNLERCLLLDQAWKFDINNLSANTTQRKQTEENSIEVLAIDLGYSENKSDAKIIPNAELSLLLSSSGDIQIHRQMIDEQKDEWQLEFRSVNNLIEVRLKSNSKERNNIGDWQIAIPEEFSRLAKQLINELLPGECDLKIPSRKQEKISNDIVSVMFDGASYKVQATEKFNWLGPYFFDASGLNCEKSLSLSGNEKIFSAKELNKVANNNRSRYLGDFVEVLASQVQASQNMHYLISDHHSDFETNDLRREINRNFKNANPLPKSIAAVYAVSDKNKFKYNDLIMVLSSDHAGIYGTPIYFRRGEKVDEEYFERHPSIKLSSEGEQQLLERALVDSGLPLHIAEKFIELYSYSELVSGKAKLTLYDDGIWYRVPSALKVDTFILGEVLFQETSKLQRRREKIYFLSVSAAIKHQKGITSEQWLASDPLSGSQYLLQLQQQEPNRIFWKDHLPQLMTRLPVSGIEQNFYFVDSKTSVKPERGIAVPIPINQTFTLPSGKEEISFVIYQGQGINQQEFSLLLSLRQPLKEDCECELTLTYTYGDEQPYKLRFSPKSEEKPFNYVDAQWGEKLSVTKERIVAIPAFPTKASYTKLCAYLGKDGETDIIEWLERNFKQLNDIYNFILYGRNERRFHFNYDDIKWIIDKDFGFYELHPQYKSIFVHKSKFGESGENNKIFSGDIHIKNDRYSLENIADQGELSQYELNKLPGSWRFPMLVFSDQGRSFIDEDLPVDFRKKGKRAIDQAQELLKILNGSNKILENELKMFLSYCHKLMPQPMVETLLEAVTDKKQLRYESNWFKYSLGDCSQQWQEELLLHMLNPDDDTGGTRATTLEIVSVAMWRDPMLVHQLTAEKIIQLAQRLADYLQEEIKQLKPSDKYFKWNSFIIRLELLLALLRTRESVDTTISSIFALDSVLNKQLLNTVEKITDKHGKILAQKLEEPRIVSRVKLAINKPEIYHRTPDLLYALKLYLSGDDGADQITITELANDA
ncbi:DUF2357 domain-containing protein [Wohlfahrtiimonas chitiniclastica]|uniref:DUF2357 domain-containing protein n=1 Tax=Wohlfahrtiimonas chitiniclastica SH04 TaxID=1261130 RepID=L8Y272_9GAMM|nr:DUF2357 domain-containing protein [Wohlfahrtiimonas chitiniclastica]ELV08561.1 Hypothetical protein F387_01159 [Wohlfahrtiimonas chitiniclastica SH04]KZS22751.1 hypothetical protein BMY_0578 [Wohlfahrtiimonas chitiniclastica]WHR55203.1 DUF2357 domain-containing protein [Wohlfahrtiimonas chitiniclastica]